MLHINNFILFLLKKNLFYFYINYSILKNINYFIYLFQFNSNKIVFEQKNIFNITISLEKNFFKSFFFFKLSKHFKIFFFSKLFYNYNYLINFNFNLNNNNVYLLSKVIYKSIYNFYNVIYSLTINKNKFLILDDDYYFALPLYNHMYSYNSLDIFKDYFFLKTNFFTFKRWVYFYSNFCLKFNINLLILFNYTRFLTYMYEIQSLDIPLAALVPLNYTNDFVDYYLFINNNYQVDKIIYNTLIIQSYFLGINFINFKNKLKYLNLFYKFSKLI